MRKNDMIFGVLWVLLGLVLTVLCCLVTLDEYWSNMGCTLIVIGIVRVFRSYRLSRSEAYREKREIDETDERLHFIRSKAWSWAGYLFVTICAISIVICKILGQNLICIVLSGAVWLMIVLFWISFFILKKKY